MMTKLDEIFEWVEDLHAQEKSDYINTASPYFLALLNAARSYAALLKLVEPDLVKLVEAKSWVETGPVNHRTEFTKAANEIARERIVRVLEVILDNLTAFGKDTSHD